MLAEDPHRPADLAPGLSTDLEAICLKCLERDTGRRYSALELAEDLVRFLQSVPVLARPIDEVERHTRWARRIGYEIGDLLERDERSCTYLARQAAIQRTVRLKLCAGPVGSPIHAALRREADAMAGLDHPNLIRLHDYGEQFGQAYLVLEHIEGGVSLFSRPAAMTARQAAEIAIMLAIGLQAVHDNGWIRGGIQPEAVLLTRDGVPKIGNFSAAQREAGAGESVGERFRGIVPQPSAGRVPGSVGVRERGVSSVIQFSLPSDD